MKKGKLKKFLIFLLVVIVVCGMCGGVIAYHNHKENLKFLEEVPEDIAHITGITRFKDKVDYSDKDNWMFLPEENTKQVDAIYLYPSSHGIITNATKDVAKINDKIMRGVADYFATTQVSVFEESCNLYVPYYRQLTVNSLLDVIENNPECLPYLASQDIYHMLDYYFENLNEGRPFILAGHSQGSSWIEVVLSDYMKEHPEYLERMVAAYVIGFSVTEEYLANNPHLKFAIGADDTGVIISYNTEGPENSDSNNCVVKEGAISINPINWKLDNTYASIEENLGSKDEEGNSIPALADAKVDTKRGVVICTTFKNTPETKEMIAEFFGEESFHLYDYSFYHDNLRKNVSDRIEAFLNK